jgi:hypothetical protein
VGAVLALDASRLARNNRDWHHLIDLCAMTQTLVIDYDGTYDPTQLNDRLVLGLKGTMSEFEMSLLRQRALESLRHKVRRGHVLNQVPVGFVRTEDDRMELTADLYVQEAIRTVFAKFRELGTVRQVLLWYHTEKVTVPTFDSGGRFGSRVAASGLCATSHYLDESSLFRRVCLWSASDAHIRYGGAGKKETAFSKVAGRMRRVHSESSRGIHFLGGVPREPGSHSG